MTSTDYDLESIPVADDEPAADPDNGSLINRLRAQRAAAKPKHLDLEIPNNGADTGGIKIVARYKRIQWQGKTATALRKIQGANTNAQAELDAECDLLITGLEQLYAQEPGSDDLVPLDPDEPMRFDERTAKLLGLKAEKAREAVYAIYGGPDGEFALKAAAARYLQFLQALRVVTESEGEA